METITQTQNKYILLVGTYTNAESCKSDGIYIFEFDAVSGHFTFKNSSDETINPSYLSVAADNQLVYAVNENEKASTVSSFRFDPESQQLTFLNKSDTLGEDPCYLIDDNYNVLAANYASGSIAVFKKLSDGSISEVQQLIQHEGKGINESRQEQAHAHMVVFSPDRKFVLITDLGADKIYIYYYYPESDNEILQLKETVNVKPGSGPRHAVFSGDGKFLYVIHELDETLSTFSYKKEGNLELLNQTNITPENAEKAESAAAIKISPDSKFLYVTDRGGANLISIYKILSDGNLELVERVSTLGENPRDFAIDPLGNFLLIAHEDTNTITIFKRDQNSGKLTFTDQKMEICSPVCLKFADL